MTTPEERYQAFIDTCVNVSDEHPPVTRVEGGPAQRRLAERASKLAAYHELAVHDTLNGKAPLMAIREGYYVMLHKANEALALAGLKTRTHRCTLLGIQGVFNAPDLADMLRRASQERRNVDYFIDPDNPALEEFAGPQSFIEETVEVFVTRVDTVIEEEGLREQ